MDNSDYREDLPVISSLGELLNELSYSWDYPNHIIHKIGDSYLINKLHIEHDMVTYKTHRWYLEPKVFEAFEVYYNTLQMLDVI